MGGMYDMHQSSSGTELERNAQRGWGGRRPGAGRKKGSSRRINGETRRQVLERAISVGINVESQNGRAEQEVANGAAVIQLLMGNGFMGGPALKGFGPT
jgi:hypothetical protein